MELLLIFTLMIVTFFGEFFGFFFEISGLKEIEKLEGEITFNNF